MWVLSIPVILLLLYIISRTYEEQDLNEKHVVVTGGSSGIGKCVAIEAVKRGANVTIIARDAVKLESAKQEIMKFCRNQRSQMIRCVPMDVCDGDEAFGNHMEVVERDLGPIYMLVNCAGTSACGKIEDMSNKDVQNMMNVNFFGTFYPTKSVIPNMKKRKSGKIVLVGSQASLLGIFGYAAYSSTKFALRGLAEALHMEVVPYNLSVTLALPPDTDTPGFANEEKTKLMETRQISSSAGLVKPEVVAKQLVDDALDGKFYSIVGLESYMLSTVCAGMTPVYSIYDLISQAMLMGPFRLIGQFYLHSFHRIIKNCAKLKDNYKKAE